MKFVIIILIFMVSCSQNTNNHIIGSVQLEKMPLKITNESKKLLISSGQESIIALAEKYNLEGKDSVLIKDKQGNLSRVFIDKTLKGRIDKFMNKHNQSIINKELYVELKVDFLQDNFYLLTEVIKIQEIDGKSTIQ